MIEIDVEQQLEIYNLNTPYYFVSGMGYDGSRHYSPNYYSWDEAIAAFKTYRDVISYFGGGQIILYGVRYDDFHIIENDWVI